MDEQIKTLLDESTDMTKEELIQKLNDIFGDRTSEIDKWYGIGQDFWLRRTTVNDYLCVQVFPIMSDSYLCYLHVLDITAFDKKSAEGYKANVYNGDKGIVKMVSDKTGRVLVDYDGTPVEYTKREFDQLKHSFAITVHKSQGDQFPIVIIPITNYHSVLLTQNLLYTAMTRARQKLIFVGDRDALEYAIRNTQGSKRNTALCDRLKVSEQKAS